MLQHTQIAGTRAACPGSLRRAGAMRHWLYRLLALLVSCGAAVASASQLPLPSQAHQADFFGRDVAIGGDYAGVPAAYSDVVVGAADAGAVYIYERQPDGSWQAPIMLTASDAGPGYGFGRSLAFSGDRLVIGSPGNSDEIPVNRVINQTYAGAAYVFERQANGTWLQVALLTASDPAAKERFGARVALEGDRLVVSAPADATSAGAVYYFQRQANGTWSELGKFRHADAGNGFGAGLAMSSGRVAVTDTVGNAFVYTSSDLAPYLIEEAHLTAGDTGAGRTLGTPVAMSGDGLMVGAPSDDDNGTDAGAVYFFGRSDSTGWSQLVKRTAANGTPTERFGFAVAMEEGVAVIGSSNVGISERGRIWVFERRDGNVWTEVRQHTSSSTTNFNYGASVSLSGSRILVGVAPVTAISGWTPLAAELTTPDQDGDGITDGVDVDIDGDGMPNIYESVTGLDPYFAGDGALDTDGDGFGNLAEFQNETSPYDRFANPDTAANRHQLIFPHDLRAADRFGHNAALHGTRAAVVSYADANEFGIDSGAVYIFDLQGSWTETAKILPVLRFNPSVPTGFGNAVALEDDLLMISQGSPASLWVSRRLPDATWSALDRLEPIATPTLPVAFGIRGLIAGSQVLSSAAGATGVAQGQPPPLPGEVFVFGESSPGAGDWSQLQRFPSSDTFSLDAFGYSMSASGTRLIVSAPDFSHVTAGAAYIFESQAGTWTEVAKLTPVGANPGDKFGYSVAIDGDRAVVSAMPGGLPTSAEMPPPLGIVFVFERQVSGNWVQTAELTAPPGANHKWFGATVQIRGDRLLAAAPIQDPAGFFRGRILEYQRQANGAWTLRRTLHSNADGPFGIARFAADGDWVLAGSTLKALNGPDSGAAYFFFDDEDNDGVGGALDNCISVANASQSDGPDADGIGDVCDLDDDNDGLFDADVPDFELTPGEFFSFTPSAGYNGPGALSFSLSDQPNWLSFNPVTGELTAAPSNDNYLDGGILSGLTLAVDDGTGQAVTSNPFSITVLDTRAPVTLLSVPGGSYSQPQVVTLLCTDGIGSGCAAVHYTLDGSLPTLASPTTSGPIPIAADTTLRYFAADHAGNLEAPRQVQYTVDAQAPSIAIAAPLAGAILDTGPLVSGTAADTGSSGLAAIDIQITGSNGTGLNAGGTALVDGSNEWVRICQGNCSAWQRATALLNFSNKVHYTARARAVDGAGNSAMTQVSFQYYDGDPAFTTLSVDLSSTSILFGGVLDAALKLTVPGDPAADLTGQQLTLRFTQPPGPGVPPEQTAFIELQAVTNADGQVTLADLGLADSGVEFDAKGTWTVQTRFTGTPLYREASSSAQSLLVGTSAGYAVLVQGKIGSNEGLDSHNKTANRIYQTLRDRNLADQNIFYFNYDPSQDANRDGLPDNALGQAGLGVDGVPSKAIVQSTIENLALAVNNNPAPVYIIFVDHGNTDGSSSEFLLGNESISPVELDGWLDTLEAALTPQAAAEARIVINGSCYSGGFVGPLAGANRVIISSAAADEVSYKGPLESDQIRVGEYFLEELFEELGRGATLAGAFEVATEKTETYTRASDGANSANPYLDTAVQHPLLDDDGDGIGTNVLQAGTTVDGALARGLYLGTGPVFDTNSAENPAEVQTVTPTRFLASTTNNALLTLTANDNAQVAQAIVEIRAPNAVLQGGILEIGGVPVTEQRAAENYDRRLLNAPATQGCAAQQFCVDYAAFAAPGRYEVFYYVEDSQTGDLSPGRRSVVYKNKGANQAPGSFALLTPANGATVRTATGFRWQASVDPDGDRITYTLRVCTDASLTQNCTVQEEISATIAVLTAGLEDLKTYYWRVEAVDFFGAVTASSSTFSFTTDNGNNVLGVIEGFVQSGIDLALLNAHSVSRANAGIPTEFLTAQTDQGGRYILITLAGRATLLATASGFQSALAEVDVPAPVFDPQTSKSTVSTARRDFVLAADAPPPSPPADSDQDGLADQDEVSLYGTSPSDADSDDDGLQDGDEVHIHGTLPTDPDSDDDGLADGAEVNQYKTRPLRADTDRDGQTDGEEVANGTNPRVNQAAVLMQLLDLLLE